MKHFRALLLGGCAIGLAIHAQAIVTKSREFEGAAPWLAGAILLMLVGWWGAERSMLELPRWPGPSLWNWRLLPMLAAVAMNGFGVRMLREAKYISLPGGLLWLGSLLLFLLACWHRRSSLRDPAPEPGAEVFSRRTEWLAVLFLILLSSGMRLYRLGDWTTGMHGDEGEAGMEAVNILEGRWVSPFLPGWYAQPNFYYWSLALLMKLFGPSLFGLRLFAAVAGVLAVVALYGFARECFGSRLALMSGLFLAVSPVAMHFSRAQFSNIVTPLCLSGGFFFLFRGLRRGSFLSLALGGYTHMLALYFYVGGRLGPLLLGGLFIGLLGLRKIPWPTLKALSVFIIACGLFIAPWASYYQENRTLLDGRAKQMLVFSNADLLASRYSIQHGPLLWLQDGFWPKVLWRQLRETLSILTNNYDHSLVFFSQGEPITQPIEGALVLLGIAWTIFRWRDVRMLVVVGWFWATILVGGMLTIDQPYMARLVGIMPALALFAALPLERMLTAFLELTRRRAIAVYAARLAMLGLFGFFGWRSFQAYYGSYIGPHIYTPTTGQAIFVRQLNDQLRAEGRPAPAFYHLGAHLIYWSYGVNRFLNHGLDGQDVTNLSTLLPLRLEGGRDAVFLIWSNNQAYLPALQAFYPDGELIPFYYGPSEGNKPLLHAYRVAWEQIQARRTLRAEFQPAEGAGASVDVASVEAPASLLGRMAFPVSARWSSGVLIEKTAMYRFRLTADAPAELRLDGKQILRPAGPGVLEGRIPLLEGLHSFELTTTLDRPASAPRLQFSLDASSPELPLRRLWWSGAGRAFLGEIRTPAGELIQRRVDGFVGFRDATSAFDYGAPFEGDWRGRFLVAEAGRYGFSMSSAALSWILVDGQEVTRQDKAGSLAEVGSVVDLAPGEHTIELKVSWSTGLAYFEFFWTPPGKSKQLMGPLGFELLGDAVPPKGAISTSSQPLGERSRLALPRAVALGKDGSLFVADTGHHQVVALSPRGDVIRAWGEPGKGQGQFEVPEDIDVDAEGLVYVLDSAVSRIQVFKPDGTWLRTIGDGTWCTAAGFDVAEDGSIWLAETCTSQVRHLAPDGQTLGIWHGGTDPSLTLAQPVDVVADGVAGVYAVDLRGRVVQLDPGSDRLLKSWSVAVGTAHGASNLALRGRWLFLSNPDRNSVQAIRWDMEPGAKDGVEFVGRAGQYGVPVGIAVSEDGVVYISLVAEGRLAVMDFDLEEALDSSVDPSSRR